MTDTPLVTQKQSLGVGALVGDTFSILFGSFLQLLVLAFIPAVLITIVQFNVASAITVETGTDPISDSISQLIASLINLAIALFGSTIVTALVVRMAYDVKTGHAVRLSRYFGSALSVVFPLFVCSVIATTAFVLGLALFILSGILLMVIWAVYAPVIVIERIGLRSFARSADLTLDYRGAVFGAIILLFVLMIVIGVVAASLTYFLFSAGGAILTVAIEAVSSGLTMAFSGIFYSLIYARLREIKEGTSMESLAEVFA